MYTVQLDGNSWCATGKGFKNLQESPAGFGDSPVVALENLILEEGEIEIRRRVGLCNISLKKGGDGGTG